MKLDTKQVRFLMESRPRVIPLTALCEAASVNYTSLYVRLRRADEKRKRGEAVGTEVTPEEGEALGLALVSALPKGFLSAHSKMLKYGFAQNAGSMLNPSRGGYR